MAYDPFSPAQFIPMGPPPGLGATGCDSQVEQAQRLLGLLELTVAVDGILGPETREALNQFYARGGLQADVSAVTPAIISDLKNTAAAKGKGLPSYTSVCGGGTVPGSGGAITPAGDGEEKPFWKQPMFIAGGVIVVATIGYVLWRESQAAKLGAAEGKGQGPFFRADGTCYDRDGLTVDCPPGVKDPRKFSRLKYRAKEKRWAHEEEPELQNPLPDPVPPRVPATSTVPAVGTRVQVDAADIHESAEVLSPPFYDDATGEQKVTVRLESGRKIDTTTSYLSPFVERTRATGPADDDVKLKGCSRVPNFDAKEGVPFQEA